MVDKVLMRELSQYDHNKPVKKEILLSFPKNKLSTLYSHRKTITGNLPGNVKAETFPFLDRVFICFIYI